MSFVFNQPRTSTQGFGISFIDHLNKTEFSDTTVRLNCYEIVWIQSGDCFFDLNLNAYATQQGSICFFAPGQVRKMRFCESIKAVQFTFSSNFFYRLCVEAKFPLINVDSRHLSRPMIININPEKATELNGILLNLQKEIFENNGESVEMRDVWLKLFMMYLRRQLSSADLRNVQNRDMQLVTQFLAILSKDYTTKKMVSDYANDLSVTPNYLNLIVKRVSGFPASHHIQQFLILEAKRQAIASVKSMKEIAYELGFDDIAHFSKFFKNKSGTNFTEFKKDWVALQYQS